MATRKIHLRMTEHVIGADGLVSFKGVDDDPALYNQNAIGEPVNRIGYPNNTVAATPSTIAKLLDITTLRDDDDGPGFYAAMRGATSNWAAANLWASPDPDTSDYEFLKTIDTAAVIGFARSVLPAD